MRNYICQCGQVLFYENSRCLSCGAETGFCPCCEQVVTLIPDGPARYRCSSAPCGATLVKCSNYAEHDVCNRCVPVPPDGSAPNAFCDCCRYNQTIPDLSVPGNREKWYRLEVAKRRLFYDLALLNLPHGTLQEGFQPPLTFDFKADVIPVNDFWRGMGISERVYTGHADGKITINIREADAVERERLRVTMGEKHRTLIGHFRHEIGHYYWTVLVQGQHDQEFAALFGDPWAIDYAVAIDRYYRDGPPTDWATHYVSAYASMHPWEDWAETFATYLDMISALETAVQMKFMPAPWFFPDDLNRMVAHYQQLGISLNEMSRSLGLLDMVPDILSTLVVNKMSFIHALCRDFTSGEPLSLPSNSPGHDIMNGGM